MHILTLEGAAQIEPARKIETELLYALAQINQQSKKHSFTLVCQTEEGLLTGGLTASTSYGWLLIKTCWVAEHYRGKGLGRRLMRRAEQEASMLGCHHVWLDTSSAKAKDFYLQLDYKIFGELRNDQGEAPAGHQRWFLKKTL